MIAAAIQGAIGGKGAGKGAGESRAAVTAASAQETVVPGSDAGAVSDPFNEAGGGFRSGWTSLLISLGLAPGISADASARQATASALPGTNPGQDLNAGAESKPADAARSQRFVSGARVPVPPPSATGQEPGRIAPTEIATAREKKDKGDLKETPGKSDSGKADSDAAISALNTAAVSTIVLIDRSFVAVSAHSEIAGRTFAPSIETAQTSLSIHRVSDGDYQPGPAAQETGVNRLAAPATAAPAAAAKAASVVSHMNRNSIEQGAFENGVPSIQTSAPAETVSDAGTPNPYPGADAKAAPQSTERTPESRLTTAGPDLPPQTGVRHASLDAMSPETLAPDHSTAQPAPAPPSEASLQDAPAKIPRSVHAGQNTSAAHSGTALDLTHDAIRPQSVAEIHSAIAAMQPSPETGDKTTPVAAVSQRTSPDTSDALAALDAGRASPPTTWIHAGARHAEAGFLDPALGWVGVRADAVSNGVHAALLPGSAEAAQVLQTHMAGLNAYLSEHHASSATVTVGNYESAQSGFAGQMGQGGQGREGSGVDQENRPHTDQGERASSSAPVDDVRIVAPPESSAASVNRMSSPAAAGRYISVMA